ncbi:MAG: endonuclease domain-containing protein [Ktedonobacteraceae bacterium]
MFTPTVSPMEAWFYRFWLRLIKDQSTYHLTAQHPVLSPWHAYNYYLDYAHIPTMISIEIDGAAYHSSPDQLQCDQERQNYLESLGWAVLRFSGSEVRCHSLRVVSTLPGTG